MSDDENAMEHVKNKRLNCIFYILFIYIHIHCAIDFVIQITRKVIPIARRVSSFLISVNFAMQRD